MPTINDGRLSGGEFEVEDKAKEERHRQILTLMTEEELRQVPTQELESLPEVQAYRAALEAKGNPSLGDPDDAVDTEHVAENIRKLVDRHPNLPLIIEILTGKKETEGTEE